MQKPKIESVETLNLVEALMFLEQNGYPGIYDKIWDRLRNHICNGYYFKFFFDENDKSEMLILKEAFHLDDEIVFFCCW